MDAEPLLSQVAALLKKRRLPAVLIGNAAAALQGSPVTTMDLDFMFRKTPATLAKLKRLADDLEAVVMRPYYPASGLYRIVRDRDGMQLDFMSKVDGIRSFKGGEMLVADLRDIIRSKEVADRPHDRAVLPRFEGRWMSKKRRSQGAKKSAPLRKESDRALAEQIRRQLALPPERRTHFLRKRLPGGGSAI